MNDPNAERGMRNAECKQMTTDNWPLATDHGQLIKSQIVEPLNR